VHMHTAYRVSVFPSEIPQIPMRLFLISRNEQREDALKYVIKTFFFKILHKYHVSIFTIVFILRL
jgi:hypothetical protein